MNVLITGSSGMVGQNLARHLKKNGFTVLGLDYQTFTGNSFWSKDDIPSQADVESWLFEAGISGFLNYRLGSFEREVVRDSVIEKLSGVQVIIHLASQSHVDRSISNPKQFIDDNVNGTVEVFEFSRHLPNLEKIILFSTDEVVACLPSGEADEKAIMSCGSVYSASKGAQELLAQAYIKKYDLPIVTTRCVNIFGTHQADEKFIPTVVRQLVREKEIPIYGSGYQSREWVSVDHVCEVLNWLALNTMIPHGNILHITGTKEIPNLAMVHILASLAGKKATVQHVEDRIGHDERYALAEGDAHILWDMPKYYAKNSFIADLEKVVNWYIGRYEIQYEYELKKGRK